MQLGPIPAAAGGVVAEDELTAGGFERGQSIRGAIRYSTDNRPEEERGPDEEDKPRGRVAWTAVLNIKGVDDTETDLAGRVMQGTVYDRLETYFVPSSRTTSPSLPPSTACSVRTRSPAGENVSTAIQ